MRKQKEDNYFERMDKRGVRLKVCPKCLEPFVVGNSRAFGLCANCSADLKPRSKRFREGYKK